MLTPEAGKTKLTVRTWVLVDLCVWRGNSSFSGGLLLSACSSEKGANTFHMGTTLRI